MTWECKHALLLAELFFGLRLLPLQQRVLALEGLLLRLELPDLACVLCLDRLRLCPHRLQLLLMPRLLTLMDIGCSGH